MSYIHICCWCLQIQSVYQDCIIVVISYPIELQLVGNLKTPQAGLYIQYMSFLRTTLQSMELLNVNVMQLSAQRMNLSNWCSAHPDAAAHVVIADQVARYLDAVAPHWAALP